MVDADEYSRERIRLALLPDPVWTLVEAEVGNAAEKSLELSGLGVLFIPIGHLLDINPRPFPLPVLAVGPSALFDAVPDGICDDLIGDGWSAAELRYRLRRLVHPKCAFADARTISCTPLRLTADDRSVDLTPIQYQLLSMLLRIRGASVPREALIAVMIGNGKRREGGRALDMHISRLRSKLRAVTSDWAHPPRIRADRGSGYSLG
ncbi:MAG: helix-turn-helix domain-containing protein [Spirochaetia bacterium]